VHNEGVEPDGGIEDTVRVAPRRIESLPPGYEDLEDTVRYEPDRSERRPLWRPPTAVVRAAHHRIRISGGEIVELDTTVYLGRRPGAPRVTVGAAPRLVTVPSPGGEVSATHLELREAGRAVVLTDLRSTNGTIVHVPGSPGRVLIGGESAVVFPGTLIDIGDGNLLEVLRPVLDPDGSS
jgi:pSer/pThr/pTyr-binding forkhead associated (FHA) protein